MNFRDKVKSLGFATALVLACSAAHAETALRIGVNAMPPSLGSPFRSSLPPTVYFTGAVFDALTRFDDKGDLRPWLATAWEPVDEVTWRFTLRDGVKFSNGAPLTADAVATAVSFLTSEAGAIQGVRTETRFLKSARVVDARTVDIVTSEPLPSWPRYATALLIPEPETWRKLGLEEFSRAPVGTGPYRVERMAAAAWTLKARPDAWNKPKVDRLEILAIPEPSTRVQAMMAGRLDIAMMLGPDDIANIEAGEGVGLSWAYPSVSGISFNMNIDGPWRDARVRRALSLAVNRDRIITQLLGGRSTAANQPAARGVLGHNPSLPPLRYDPAAAKALLAEAGYPKGFSFTLEVTTGAAPNDAAIFQQIAADFAAVGATATIRVTPAAQFLTKLARGRFDGEAFAAPWPTTPSRDILRAMFMQSCMRPDAWWCDQEIMPTVRAAFREADPAKGLALRSQIMARYVAEAPAVFLFEQTMYAGLSRKVTGFRVDTDFIPFHELGVTP
jgi:peptide/nickel transport system substrate-binding protein